jgi:polysaccharide chain length determinant protein (PEP-CTERM system associated)
MARRRWLWILLPTVVVGALTVAVGRRLPRLYTSEALIVVEPQQVPADFVQPTVSGTVADRLEYIQEQILSRTQLSQIIAKYGLYANQSYTPDQRVSRMLSDITVKPIMADSPMPKVSAFRISYQGPSPALAQEVCRDLSQLFISENLTVRAQQAQGTEAFIDGRLQQATQKLRSLEGQLKQLKSKYMGSLPEQEGANLQVMSQLQAQLQANADNLARAQQQKTYLISLSQAVQGATGAAVAQAPKPPNPLEADLRNAKAQLAVDEQLYTPAYPGVVQMKAQVKALTEQLAAQKQEAAAPKPASPAKAAPAKGAAKPALPPQDQGQIVVLNQQIQEYAKQQTKINKQIADMQARIERLPAVEEQLTNIQNAYDVAKANYTTLLEKKDQASTGAAMEQQAEGEEFRIVDPANLPQKPSSPDLSRIDLLGGMAGVLLGLGCGFMVEMRDAVVRVEADLEYYTKVPILATLPLLGAAALPPAAAALLPGSES